MTVFPELIPYVCTGTYFLDVSKKSLKIDICLLLRNFLSSIRVTTLFPECLYNGIKMHRYNLSPTMNLWLVKANYVNA